MKTLTQLSPLFTQKLLTRMALGILAGMGVSSSLLPQPVLANPGYDQPLRGLENQRDRDSLSPTNNGDFNVFDFIHRAQTGSIRDMNEFNSEQRRNLDDAAAKFRLQQQERLRDRDLATPANSAVTSPAVKN